MGDHAARKKAAMMNRMRRNLDRKREALADQFDFKMYIVFRFKDQKKKTAIYEVDDVNCQMTVNHQLSVLQGVRSNSYTYDSSKEMLSKDIVQFHAKTWQSTRQDVNSCKTVMDFFLWPRNDVESVTAHLFSKWKDEDEPFRPLDAVFTLPCREYESDLMHRMSCEERKEELIAANADESLFLFVTKQQFKTSKNRMTLFNLRGVCVFIPQDQLMMWKPGTEEDVLTGHIL